jgi:hypothetical protein
MTAEHPEPPSQSQNDLKSFFGAAATLLDKPKRR